MPDRRQQYLVIEGLCQELNRPRLHRAHRLWNVAVPREEDNRHVGPFYGYPLLQFQTIEAGQGNIEHETTRSKCAWAVEEFLRGAERLWLPAFVLYQSFQR